MKIDFYGFDEGCITLTTDGTFEKGDLVKIKDGETAEKCTSKDDIIGVVMHQRGDLVCVQIKGYVRTAYEGSTTLTSGYHKLTTGTNGTVTKDDTDGREHLVFYTSTNEICFLL